MFNQYSSLDFLSNTVEDDVADEQNVRIPPPSTYKEWLEYNNIANWPEDPEGVNDRSWLDSVKIGTFDELCNEVKERAPCHIHILDDILKEVVALEEKVTEYSNFFFSDISQTPHVELIGNEKYLQVHKEPDEDVRRESNVKKKKDSLKARNMEFAVFPGFHPYEMTLLPGALEAPQLLNNITKIQDFPPVFRKMWKQFFLSDVSVGILQDAFWWLFLECSKSTSTDPSSKKKNNTMLISQSKLFGRLASNFVSLFISVPYATKDSFFKHYPDCLSQAVYSAFFVAFPLSTSKFNREFRENLVTLIFEWVNGTHPQEQQVLKHWKLEALEIKNQCSHDAFDEPLQVLKSRLSFDEETFLDFSGNHNTEVADPRMSPQINTESHPAGHGPDFDKVAFNVFGQSPFIKHYLGTKQLQKEEEILNKVVTRTEINEKKLIGSQTYNELIAEHKRKSKMSKKKYDKVSSQLSKEIQQGNIEKRKELRKMIKLQRQLVNKHYDIKILSHKIMDMMAAPDITGKMFVSNVLNGKLDE